MSSETQADSNTKFVQVKFPVPRDPAAYTATKHYRQRLNGRKDPAIKNWIVEECIEEGRCVGVDADDVPGPDVDDGVHVFAFDREIWSEGIHHWRVVVAIVPKAFTRDDIHHRVVTAYCACHSDDPEEVCE